ARCPRPAPPPLPRQRETGSPNVLWEVNAMNENRDALRVALYARVSSDHQADAGTIASQVAELRERVARDGGTLDDDACFLDDGCSGATLIRPALERLRDQVANGAIDRLYVHSP